MSKLPSACSDEQFLAWNFFQKFWAVLDFLRKIWHVSQTSIFVSREKIPEEIIFLFFFSDFFRSLSETFFSDFWPKNFKKFSKLPSTCPEEHVVAWIFLKKIESFWIFCRNFWHGSQNSIYVSRVKIAEELVFFFLFRFFFDFWAKIFRNFGQETSRSCQNYFLRVQTNKFWLGEAFKSFEQFCFFCRHLWNGSQNSIYVSRVKSPEETVFLTFLFRIFSNFERNIFRLLVKKLQEVVKTTLCVFRRTTFGLKFFFKSFEPVWIFCRNLWHGSQTSIFVSRVKIPEEIIFLFFFPDFFRSLSETFFQIFGQKTSRSCQN